uniref:Flocculation protein FLO11-like n=1 Tax=Crassostrea virginica TaxID=6565 RepID=A0A8B8C634_CRAVI|nr:flocculation protein FLO11-like [Crassostrea virginica]
MSDMPDEIVLGRSPDRRYRVIFIRVRDPSTLGPHVGLTPCGNYKVVFRLVPDIEPDGEGWLTTRAPRAPSRRRGVRRSRSPSPQTRLERMRTIVDDMVASFNPEMLSELVMSINRRMRNSLRRSPSSPTRPPSSRATRTQTAPSTSQPSTSSTQTSGCAGLASISSVLPPRRSPPPRPPPPTRTAPTSTTTSSRTTSSSSSSSSREGTVAGAPVSSSAEGGIQAVPSAPPMDQDSGNESDRTLSPPILSTTSTPPRAMHEHIYVDPNADQQPWSSTPPPPCCPPAYLHLACLPIWAERIRTRSPILQTCLLCAEKEAHHVIRCRQCRQLSGCCACIWRYQRSRYNSGCPCCQYTGLLPPSRRRRTQQELDDLEEFLNSELPDLPE